MHARKLGRQPLRVTCENGVDQWHKAVVLAGRTDRVERGRIGRARPLRARIKEQGKLFNLTSGHAGIERSAPRDTFGKVVGKAQACPIRHFAHGRGDSARVRGMKHGD